MGKVLNSVQILILTVKTLEISKQGKIVYFLNNSLLKVQNRVGRPPILVHKNYCNCWRPQVFCGELDWKKLVNPTLGFIGWSEIRSFRDFGLFVEKVKMGKWTCENNTGFTNKNNGF